MSGKEFRGLKGLKKQRRIQVIALAAVALLGATGLIGYAMQDGINFFRSPTQVMEAPPASGETFRIGGLVVEGSINRGTGTEVSFAVTDTNATVPVRYTGILPDLFGKPGGRLRGYGRHRRGRRQRDGPLPSSELFAHLAIITSTFRSCAKQAGKANQTTRP